MMRELICVLSLLLSFTLQAQTDSLQTIHASSDTTLVSHEHSVDTLTLNTSEQDSSLYTHSYSAYVCYNEDSLSHIPLVPELKLELQSENTSFHNPIHKIDSTVFHPKRPDKVIFRVHVIDTLTGKQIPAHIFMTSITKNGKRYNGSGVTTSNGNFEIKVSQKSHFEINVNGPGFYTAYEEVTIKDEEIENGVIERTYKLHPLKKGDVIRLNQVNFDQGDYQLKQESIIQLTRLVAMLKANPEMIIQLEGHTESTSSYDSSIKLSQKRVYEVRYFLVRKGINVHRIKAIGYGNTKPITTKTDAESQLINRRVEFRVLKN